MAREKRPRPSDGGPNDAPQTTERVPPRSHRKVTALGLLTEQMIAANIARYVAEQLIAAVLDRMAFMQVSPEAFRAALEALRFEMHGEIDRMIDEAGR